MKLFVLLLFPLIAFGKERPWWETSFCYIDGQHEEGVHELSKVGVHLQPTQEEDNLIVGLASTGDWCWQRYAGEHFLFAGDFQAALKWYKLAALQGDARSEYEVGRMYNDGSGVPKSYEEAANWYRKAANQGYWMAQSSLGSAYSLGHGVPEDLVMEYMWQSLSLASLQTTRNLNDVERDRYPKELSRLEERMTPAQIMEAQRRSAEWRPIVSPTPTVRKKR